LSNTRKSRTSEKHRQRISRFNAILVRPAIATWTKLKTSWPAGQSTPRRHARNSANADKAAYCVTAADLTGTGYGAKLVPYAGGRLSCSRRHRRSF
jgi:hypothetical protein